MSEVAIARDVKRLLLLSNIRSSNYMFVLSVDASLDRYSSLGDTRLSRSRVKL